MRVSGAERGSALALVPAGFLVLVLLGALAVDSATAYLGQRQLHDDLSAAATDAVAAAVDNRTFYGAGLVEVDPVLAAKAVCASLTAQGPSQLHALKVSMELSGTSLRLHATAQVAMVFGRALPGFGHRAVSSSALAVLSSGPGRPPPPTSMSPARALACST